MRHSRTRTAVLALAGLAASTAFVIAVGPSSAAVTVAVPVPAAPAEPHEAHVVFTDEIPEQDALHYLDHESNQSTTPVDPSAPLRQGPPLAPEAIPQTVGGGIVASTDLTVIQSSDIGTSHTSMVPEPSAGAGASGVLATWNWYSGRSIDGGVTFQYVDPGTAFPSAAGGFCCDQLAVYDKVYDQYIWIVLYSPDGSSNNVIRVARAKGLANLKSGNFTYWDWTAQYFGAASGAWLDHPKVALSGSYLYVEMQEIGGSNRQIVNRSLLSDLSAGGSLGSTYFNAGVSGAGLVQGAGTTMYIGGHVSTSKLRVWSWPDTGTLTSTDVTHTAYPASTTHNCARSGGSATSNWCGRSADNVEAGAVGHSVITFAWNAPQGTGGFGTFSAPYEHVVRINETTKALIDEPYVYNSTYAFHYFSLGVNARGDIGGTFLWGGGSSGQYLQCGLLLRDSGTTGSGFDLFGWYSSDSDTSEAVAGDYLQTVKHGGGPNVYAGTCYNLVGGGDTSHLHPRYITFGRTADLPPYRPSSITVGPGTSAGQIKVQWTAPSGGSGGAPITNYQVWRGSSSGQESLLTTVGNVLTYTDSGLAAGSTWYYRVAAVTSLGQSPLSSEGSGSPYVPPSVPPSAPLNLSAVPGSSVGSMNVSWSAPSSSGSSAITTYRLCRGTFSGSSSVCWNLPSWQFSYTDSGLTILTQRYYYRVAAINAAGQGPWSNESCMRPYPWLAALGCQ